MGYESINDKMQGFMNKYTCYSISSDIILHMRVLFIGLLAILHAFPCNAMARADEDSLLYMLRDVVNTKYEKFRNDSLPANFVGGVESMIENIRN